MGKILLVDDDDQLRGSFYNLLKMEGHTVRTAASGEEALALAHESLPDVVIMDVRMPGMDGLTTLHHLRKREPRLPVIIMTAYSTTEAAIEATKLGAFDYLLKPFDIPDVLTILDKALEAGRVMRGRVALSADAKGHGAKVLVGKSRIMHDLYKAIGRVAPTDALVLLRGESGTGKELVASAIYQYSGRGKQPFSIINCAAIPDALLESELFGYERGAFTNALAQRIGKIERTEGGTVFLDEIGDVPLAVQAKLLRLLQEKQIERLGGREPIDVDVRIIAATNRDLEKAVASGRFREDLYYRLNVVALHLPPLRERKEDIPLLIQHFINFFSEKEEVPAPDVAPAALEQLMWHSWPGNVRELANLLRKIFIFNRGGVISAADVNSALNASGQEQGAFARNFSGGNASGSDMQDTALGVCVRRMLHEKKGERVFDSLMDEVGGIVIREALTQCGGNRSRAARMLGLSRPTLLARIGRYGL